MRLMAEIVGDRPEGPLILHESWTAGRVSDLDLCGLIPDTWLYVDRPEQILGTAAWVRMFRAAGFLSLPHGLPRPAGPLTIFRGASPERMAGMSWTRDVNRADQFRQRHSWHAPTAIYQTVVSPAAVLALLERRGESPPEVVVDPEMLSGIDQIGDIHPQRFRELSGQPSPLTTEW